MPLGELAGQGMSLERLRLVALFENKKMSAKTYQCTLETALVEP